MEECSGGTEEKWWLTGETDDDIKNMGNIGNRPEDVTLGKETRLEAEMRMTQSRIGNYDPKLILFMVKASRNIVEIQFDERKKATMLRQKMYKLRELMRKTDHPDLHYTEQMTLHIEPRGNKWALIGKPVIDPELDDVFAQAGISFDNIEEIYGGAKQVQRTTSPVPDNDTEDMVRGGFEKTDRKVNGPDFDPDFNDAAGPYGQVKLPGDK